MEGYNLESLNDIKTIVFLSSNDSEATDMNDAIIKVLKCGLNNKINLMDFSQYDFSYISTKGNFNSEFVINQLDNSSKLLLGDGENDISIVEKILFPTLSNENDSNNINEYFGYILLNNYKFSLLEVPKNTKYILLLDKWQTREDILNKYIYLGKSTVTINDVEYTFVSGTNNNGVYKYYKKYEYINKLRYKFGTTNMNRYIAIYNKFIISDIEYSHGWNSSSQFVVDSNNSSRYTIDSNDYFTIKEISSNIYFSCKLNRDNWKVEWVDKINNLSGSSNIVQKVKIGSGNNAVEYTITDDYLESASGTKITINKTGYAFVPEDFPSIEFEESDNINQRRAISLYFPESGKESLGINVMYQSYLLDNTNPNRNANEVYLRNDDFYKEISDINIISEQSYGDKKFYYNKSTGTLLGNKKNSEELIIFNSKKPNDTDKKFNPKVRYNLGDVVKIDSIEWISLSNNNVGNIPSCSSNWTKRSTYESILLNKVKVSLDLDIDESVSKFNRDFSEYDLGNINKSGIITVENDLRLSWDLENRFKYSHIELDGGILENSATITGNTATITSDSLTDVNNCSVVVKPKEVILKINIDNLDTDKLSRTTIKINNIILNLNNNDNVNIIDKTLEISKLFPKDIITISNSELIIDGFDVCILSKLKDNSGYEIIVPENIRFDSSSIIIEGSISCKINKVIKLESEISNLISDSREYIGPQETESCIFNFYFDGDTTIVLDNLTTNFNFYKNGEPVNFTRNKDKLTSSDESISIENSDGIFKLTAIVGEEDITIKIEKNENK